MWSFTGSAASIAAFVAITQTAGGTGLHPEQRGGPQRQRRMAEGRLFCFAMQRPAGPAENSRTAAIGGPGRLPSDRPLEGRGRGSPALGRPATELSTLIGAKRRLNDSGRQEQEAGDVLRCKLNPQRCSEGIEAKDVQILVEIAQPR